MKDGFWLQHQTFKPAVLRRGPSSPYRFHLSETPGLLPATPQENHCHEAWTSRTFSSRVHRRTTRQTDLRAKILIYTFFPSLALGKIHSTITSENKRFKWAPYFCLIIYSVWVTQAEGEASSDFPSLENETNLSQVKLAQTQELFSFYSSSQTDILLFGL